LTPPWASRTAAKQLRTLFTPRCAKAASSYLPAWVSGKAASSRRTPQDAKAASSRRTPRRFAQLLPLRFQERELPKSTSLSDQNGTVGIGVTNARNYFMYHGINGLRPAAYDTMSLPGRKLWHLAPHMSKSAYVQNVCYGMTHRISESKSEARGCRAASGRPQAGQAVRWAGHRARVKPGG